MGQAQRPCRVTFLKAGSVIMVQSVSPKEDYGVLGMDEEDEEERN